MRLLSFAGLAAEAVLAISLCCPQFAIAASTEAITTGKIVSGDKLTYEVTLVDSVRSETQSLSLPAGGSPKILDMAGGFLEIAPPRSASGASGVSLYLNVGGKPVMLHNAQIVAAPEKPIQVAYLVCGAAVTYYSPRPAKMPKCASAAAGRGMP